MFALFVIREREREREYHWVVFPNFTLLSLFAQSGVTANQSWENGLARHPEREIQNLHKYVATPRLIRTLFATANLNSAYNPPFVWGLVHN